MHYEYLEDEAVADIAFRARGETYEDVLRAAAQALLNVMLEEPGQLEERVEREIAVEAEGEALLLFDVLQELIFYKDAEELLLRLRDVHVTRSEGAVSVRGTAVGEKLDPKRHHLGTDVKAVTLHRFYVRRVDGGWEAHVVLDV